MKKGFFIIVGLFVFNDTVFSQDKEEHLLYPFEYNQAQYAVVKIAKSWWDAVEYAVEKGAYLVEINNAEEQNAIYDVLINKADISPHYTSVLNGGGIAYLWIGATDQYEEGVWIWDGDGDSAGICFWMGEGKNGNGNGKPVNNAYVNWGGISNGTCNEPDNSRNKQHFGAIGLTGWPKGTTRLGCPGEWNDIFGSSQLYFVIEYLPKKFE
ncbi:MAG: C-type lectin domain-containing protein [Candidatus Marinimicrobia bacterium]|nr:C-type lectin domain-containing protein [Candidatus Neomarinimicrobiota bacterium]